VLSKTGQGVTTTEQNREPHFHDSNCTKNKRRSSHGGSTQDNTAIEHDPQVQKGLQSLKRATQPLSMRHQP
jgi:hypothetical protein